MHHMNNQHMVMQMMMERYYAAATPRIGFSQVPSYEIQNSYHPYPSHMAPMVPPYENMKYHHWAPSAEYGHQVRNFVETALPGSHAQAYASNYGKLRSQYLRAAAKELAVKKEQPCLVENTAAGSTPNEGTRASYFQESKFLDKQTSQTESGSPTEQVDPALSPETEERNAAAQIAPQFSFCSQSNAGESSSRELVNSSRQTFAHRQNTPKKREEILDQIIMGNLKVEGVLGRAKAQQRREEIRQMLKFIVEQCGKISNEKMNHCSKIFKNDKKLCELYQCLLVRYNSCVKTKEEKIKYVMRKCFKLMFEKIESTERQQDVNDKRTAEDIFYESYFLSSKETLSKIMERGGSKKKAYDRSKQKGKQKGCDPDHLREDSYKDILIPFRKKSENKTMNKDYFTKIFAFEKFCYGYLDFLDKFCILAIRDNKVKFDTTVKKLESILNSSKPISFKGFKRMPWLLSWIEDSESIARKLTKFIDEKILIAHKKSRQNQQKGFEVEMRKRSNSL